MTPVSNKDKQGLTIHVTQQQLDILETAEQKLGLMEDLISKARTCNVNCQQSEQFARQLRDTIGAIKSTFFEQLIRGNTPES